MSSPNSNEHFDDRFSISSETLAATRISLARAFDWVAEADQERLNQRASRIRAIRAEWRDAGWDDDGPWCPQEMVTREYDRQRALSSAAILSETPRNPSPTASTPTGDPSNDAWSLGINLGLHPEPRWDDNGNRVDEEARVPYSLFLRSSDNKSPHLERDRDGSHVFRGIACVSGESVETALATRSNARQSQHDRLLTMSVPHPHQGERNPAVEASVNAALLKMLNSLRGRFAEGFPVTCLMSYDIGCQWHRVAHQSSCSASIAPANLDVNQNGEVVENHWKRAGVGRSGHAGDAKL
ncbi:hypothetical protein B0H14DRAFT_2559406 [Mycena olivaceomarginata]|nr:hypothetical protein B0H14DRAFT_2559406 [Mycena olivaceomarginata]